MEQNNRFENQRLDGAVFHDCSAAGARFDDVNLGQSTFVNVNLRGSNFKNVDVSGVSIGEANAAGTRFDDVNLRRSNFGNVNLQGSVFRNVDLSGVSIDDANIEGLRIFGHDVQALIRAEERRRESEGQVSFLEIGSGDAAATRTFFGKVFGWTCHDEAWFQTQSIKVGTHGDDPSPQVYVSFSVTDIEAAAGRVREAGGEADQPTTEPGFGRFVNCRAPDGIRFGLHLAHEKA